MGRQKHWRPLTLVTANWNPGLCGAVSLFRKRRCAWEHCEVLLQNHKPLFTIWHFYHPTAGRLCRSGLKTVFITASPLLLSTYRERSNCMHSSLSATVRVFDSARAVGSENCTSLKRLNAFCEVLNHHDACLGFHLTPEQKGNLLWCAAHMITKLRQNRYHYEQHPETPLFPPEPWLSWDGF